MAARGARPVAVRAAAAVRGATGLAVVEVVEAQGGARVQRGTEGGSAQRGKADERAPRGRGVEVAMAASAAAAVWAGLVDVAAPGMVADGGREVAVGGRCG